MNDDPRATSTGSATSSTVARSMPPCAASEPLTRSADPDVAGDAWLLIGTARYRLDDEPGALIAWRSAADTNGESAWLGWRSAAEQLVRDGDLDDAITAYREADRRAPVAERGAIANRIAWLLKETGHDFDARRQFNRARGALRDVRSPPSRTPSSASASALFGIDARPEPGCDARGRLPRRQRRPAGQCEPDQRLRGRAGRVVAHLHERLLPPRHHPSRLQHVRAVPVRLDRRAHVRAGSSTPPSTCSAPPAAACSPSSSTRAQFAAGASGAIFGIIGLLFVVSRRHHAVLGREARSVMAGIGTYLVFLLSSRSSFRASAWTGHLGGLVVGRHARLPPAADGGRDDGRDVADADGPAALGRDAPPDASGRVRRRCRAARGRLISRRGAFPRLTAGAAAPSMPIPTEERHRPGRVPDDRGPHERAGMV